jgi:hypothetical protein
MDLSQKLKSVAMTKAEMRSLFLKKAWGLRKDSHDINMLVHKVSMDRGLYMKARRYRSRIDLFGDL